MENFTLLQSSATLEELEAVLLRPKFDRWLPRATRVQTLVAVGQICERMLARLRTMLKRIDLLVLDELGFVTLPQAGAELLFDVVSDRLEKGSIVLTTNLAFEEWVSVVQPATHSRELKALTVEHNSTSPLEHFSTGKLAPFSTSANKNMP